jgi:hypothetical protein
LRRKDFKNKSLVREDFRQIDEAAGYFRNHSHHYDRSGMAKHELLDGLSCSKAISKGNYRAETQLQIFFFENVN